ncbi:MAG: phosphoribosylamine--glycine ligase [Thermoanaerobaculum sp.]|nr:phosphoribosylamine--glycine ligase [Thermoanaerobaculum sp.]
MKLLVVGGGAREHALVWKLASSPLVEELYAAPGNPGMAALADCVPIRADAIVELADFAESLRIDLTVVGPELPLVLGIRDEFERRNLLLVGPSRRAAEVEGSKAFTKLLCQKYGIPTATGEVVASRQQAERAVQQLGLPVVLKADGLAAGKGVLVCRTAEELEEALVRFFDQREFAAAGERVVVEECLAGEEVSFLVLTDGRSVWPLPAARDYKRLKDGDEGPNTGGMGAFSPAPLPREVASQILTHVIYPALQALAQEGRPYQGILYAGLMLTPEGPKLLEFNCRLGDPETQVVLPRLDGDLVPVLLQAAKGELASPGVSVIRQAAACVVVASRGYPQASETGDPISGIEEAQELGALVFHAGTAVRDGRVVTAGGRVLSLVGTGPTLREAVELAYRAVSRVAFAGMQFRRDVGRGFY